MPATATRTDPALEAAVNEVLRTCGFQLPADNTPAAHLAAALSAAPAGTVDLSSYPPNAPTVAGGDLTVDLFLRNPARVQRALQDLTRERFIADFIFSPGPTATGGAVLYDRVVGQTLYMDRDVQAIEPGNEFPILTVGEEEPRVAPTVKWGGAAMVTREAVLRDNRDVLGRQLLRLRNTIVRKVDTVAVAVYRAAPVQSLVAAALWTATATSEIDGDLEEARTMIDDADMGYVADTVMIHPRTRTLIKRNKPIRDLLRNGGGTGGNATSPMLSRDLAGLLGFDNWIVSNRVPDTEVHVLQRRVIGSISDEAPLSSEVIPEPRRQRTVVQADRLTVPYVTDPKAGVIITGIR